MNVVVFRPCATPLPHRLSLNTVTTKSGGRRLKVFPTFLKSRRLVASGEQTEALSAFGEDVALSNATRKLPLPIFRKNENE